MILSTTICFLRLLSVKLFTRIQQNEPKFICSPHHSVTSKELALSYFGAHFE